MAWTANQSLVVIGIVTVSAILLRVWLNGCTCSEVVDLTDKNVIITGGTSGIGLETAKALYAMGAHVILPVRNLSKGEAVAAKLRAEGAGRNGTVSVVRMDLNSVSSVTKFVDRFNSKFKHLHILINNAGVWPHEHRDTPDGLQEIFQVNHLTHFLLTGLLLPKMRTAGNKSNPARVVTLSSGLHYRGDLNWTDLESGRVFPISNVTYDSMKAYSNSKLLNVVFAKELQRRIDASTQYAGLVTSTSVHPGIIVTGLHREDKEHRPWFYALYLTVVSLVGKSETQGAQTSIYAAIARDAAGQGGAYLADCNVKTPHAAAEDPANGERLWKLSVELLKKESAPVRRLAL